MENYSNPEDLAYDLRQRYAKIVGDHLEDVADARMKRDYAEYFRALENLYTIVQHKFKVDKKEKNKKEETMDYNSLRKTIIEIANANSEAWKGRGTNPEEIAKIEEGLRAMERLLYSKMNESNMFGAKREQEGL